MSTKYGTLPTSSTPRPMDYFSRAQETGRAVYALRRPWNELFDRHAFGKPESFADATARARRNLSHFRVNYALIVLCIVFLSLLWHPISLIVLIVMFVFWGFLYFCRDEPLVIFGRTLAEGLVFWVLTIITFVVVMLTNAILPFLIGLLIGVVIVILHATFRLPDSLSMDEDEAAAGGMYSVVDSPVPSSSARV
ncbi:PRA1 family protein F2 [Cryptomeria japonica]|uniref:PRA1 family protein F2 n=1 Tax=Cryptomeria japonica TaxID=3369 RepID=UPI0025AB71EE|nr:PRA1 family protein F2 [Cryptomeria japonica]